jgi:hypothetical protein
VVDVVLKPISGASNNFPDGGIQLLLESVQFRYEYSFLLCCGCALSIRGLEFDGKISDQERVRLLTIFLGRIARKIPAVIAVRPYSEIADGLAFIEVFSLRSNQYMELLQGQENLMAGIDVLAELFSKQCGFEGNGYAKALVFTMFAEQVLAVSEALVNQNLIVAN